MPSSGSDMVGRDFGGYQLLRELGVGGMGVVYLAEHRLLGRRAALKTIRAEIANDRSFSRRFLLEARAVAALNHPSIVRLYDFAFEEDTPYMVMEYVTGQSLEDVLDGGRKLDARAAVELLSPVAAALDHAHKHGVVHRDVKPANVLMADDGRTLIMDFGLASLNGFSMTEDPEAFMGTPDYIAPEQVAGQPVDGRADIYSLAAVVYEAVTGDKPWHGRTWMEIARRRLTESPPRAEDVPAPFAAALARGMARQPDQRPRSATALLESLSAALEPAAQPFAFRQTVRSRPVADEPPMAGNGAAETKPPATGVARTEPRLAVVEGEPSTPPTATPPTAAAGGASAAEVASSGVAATEPRASVVVTGRDQSVANPTRRLVMPARMPHASLVAVAAATGLAMGVAWLSLLMEPTRSLIRGVFGH